LTSKFWHETSSFTVSILQSKLDKNVVVSFTLWPLKNWYLEHDDEINLNQKIKNRAPWKYKMIHLWFPQVINIYKLAPY
jgi:hypothetical protein